MLEQTRQCLRNIEKSLAAAGVFLSDFLHPAHSPEFLAMVLRDTWQTVAPMHTGRGNPAIGGVDHGTGVAH